MDWHRDRAHAFPLLPAEDEGVFRVLVPAGELLRVPAGFTPRRGEWRFYGRPLGEDALPAMARVRLAADLLRDAPTHGHGRGAAVGAAAGARREPAAQRAGALRSARTSPCRTRVGTRFRHRTGTRRMSDSTGRGSPDAVRRAVAAPVRRAATIEDCAIASASA